uniref:Magnesium transporter n=1 Tax=Odontella aurita TaxID=265563 RepID=A0A7S4HRH7_9STRA
MFDAHKPSIQLLAAELSETFDSKAKEAQECSTGENLVVDDDYSVRMKYIGEPFELVFIEEVLRDACDTFNRRLRVYEPIVDTFMSRTTNEVFSDAGVQKLVPIKDSLQDFELTVKQCLECLTHLLGNDEDMLGLLLTEKAKASSKGEHLRHEMHEAVELLFEEYARQLSNVLHEVHFLQRRVQSKQELVALSLDAYRNRMIRMNVYLSIVGIGLASATTVAGFYGMNLINGHENSATAYDAVVAGTSLTALLIVAGCTSYLSGNTMRKRAAQRLEEIETISGALSDMAALDYTIKVMVDQGKPMNKTAFSHHLRESRHSGDVMEREVDMLFDVLDISQDGKIYTEDFRSIESFGHSTVMQCKINPGGAEKPVPLVSDSSETSRQQFVGESVRPTSRK